MDKTQLFVEYLEELREIDDNASPTSSVDSGFDSPRTPLPTYTNPIANNMPGASPLVRAIDNNPEDNPTNLANNPEDKPINLANNPEDNPINLANNPEGNSTDLANNPEGNSTDLANNPVDLPIDSNSGTNFLGINPNQGVSSVLRSMNTNPEGNPINLANNLVEFRGTKRKRDDDESRRSVENNISTNEQVSSTQINEQGSSTPTSDFVDAQPSEYNPMDDIDD